MIAFLGHIDIMEVETIGFHETGYEINMTDSSRPEVKSCQEIHLMSDTVFQFAVSKDLMSNIAM